MNKASSKPEKWILLGIPALFLIGACMHFLYDFSGKMTLIGAISPVNESVWEHSKMVLLPVILWWVLYYIVNGKKYCIDKNAWMTGGLVSLVVSLLAMPMIYYFYTGAFGVEILIVDMLILLVAVFLGQMAGLHFYRYSKGIDSTIVILLFVIIVLIFVAFTFNPPHFPIFMDGSTGTYGI